MQRGPERTRPGERNSIQASSSGGSIGLENSWKVQVSTERLACVTSVYSTRGRQPLDPAGRVSGGHSRGQGPRMALTMTTSPGIGVGSLSRNLTFSSLTGTSNARLSAEMVSSAGLLRARAVSTTASVCRKGPRAGLGTSVNRLCRIQHQPARAEQLFSPAPSRSTVVPDTLFPLNAIFPPSTPPLSSCPFPVTLFPLPP